VRAYCGPACAQVKVIALTRHNDAGFVRRLLDAGAAGYVLKQSPSTELIRAIRSVAGGERYVDGSIRMAATLLVDTRDQLALPSTDAELSPEEENVLRLIAFAHSNQEIATILSLEPSQVLRLRATAMAKAGLLGRGAIVRYAEARGWLNRS
jgi:DNA-binding NarL/FixJ family response regulator